MSNRKIKRKKNQLLNFNAADPEEIHANQFACALLMPEKQFRAAWEENPRVWFIVYKFKVPIDSVFYRLKMLGIDINA